MAGVDGNARRRSMDEHCVGRHLHSTGRRNCGIDRRRCSSGHDEDDDLDQDVIIDTHQQQRHQFHHHHPHPRVLPIDNFSDVYGGPPRSGTAILPGRHDRHCRCLSGNHLGTPGSCTAASATNFYEEIFCSPAGPQTDVLCHVQCRHVNHHPGHERTSAALSPLVHSRTTRRGKRSSTNAGRNLPGFSIPPSSSSPSASATSATSATTEEGFYDDIFGCSNYGNINSSGGYRRRNTTSSSRASSCNYGMSASSSKSNYPISISKSKSKSKASDSSSSVLSSEDTLLAMSPPGPNSYNNMIPSTNFHTNCILQPPPSHPQDFRLHHCGQHHPRGDEDKDEKEDIILSFASKLRPITIPTRSTRSRSSSEYEHDPSPPPSAILDGDGDTFAEDAGSSRNATVMSNSTVNPMLSTTSTNTTATTSVDQYLSSLSPPPPSPNPKRSSLYNLDVFQHQYQHPQSSAFNTCLANSTGSPPDVARTAAAGGGGVVNTCDYAPGSPSSDLFSIYMEPPTTKMTGTQSKSMMEISITQQDQNAGEEIYAGKSKSETDQGVCIKGIDDGNEASTRVMSIFTKREETEGSAAYGEEIDWAKEFWNRAGPTAGG